MDAPELSCAALPLEALAILVAKRNGGLTPGTEAWNLNNPGLLRVFGRRTQEDVLYRSFPTWRAGFDALLFDLRVKCSGKSRSGLKATSPLSDLLESFSIVEPRKDVAWLSRACPSHDLNLSTPIKDFYNGD